MLPLVKPRAADDDDHHYNIIIINIIINIVINIINIKIIIMNIVTDPLMFAEQVTEACRISASFDGGRRNAKCAASAYVIQITSPDGRQSYESLGKWLPGRTAVMTEALALEMLVDRLTVICGCGG